VASKGYFFDRQGQMLDEIDAVFVRGYKPNDVTTCNFEAPTADLHNTDVNTNFGDFLVILNSEGLAAWVGRIDPPQSWGDDKVEHTAYSAEDVFNIRNGPITLPYSIHNPAGAIFRELIKIANNEEDTLVRPGEIYEGGTMCGALISPLSTLMTNVRGLVKRSGQEWDITPSIVKNRLTLYANWYEKRGQVLDRSFNPENCKMHEGSLSVVGPIYNVILGLGQENSQGGRKLHMTRDLASIAKYGMRFTKYEVNFESQEAVDYFTENVDDLYPLLRLGNIAPYENPKAGFGKGGTVGTQAYVRIMAMAYSDDEEGVELTLQEEVL
jgi:hypothetical protein